MYSFGVILTEMITGRKVLDDSLPDEDLHLVTWFRRRMQNNDSLENVIDPSIEANDEETMSNIRTVSDLAVHCCANDPHQRPDMGHIVNVLSPLVQAWKPQDYSYDGKLGIDLNMSLPQTLRKWQSWDEKNMLGDDVSSGSHALLLPK